MLSSSRDFHSVSWLLSGFFWRLVAEISDQAVLQQFDPLYVHIFIFRAMHAKPKIDVNEVETSSLRAHQLRIAESIVGLRSYSTK